MHIEVWTPRGIEFVEEQDFRLNWDKVRGGFILYDTYDRKPRPYNGLNGNGYQPIGDDRPSLPTSSR